MKSVPPRGSGWVSYIANCQFPIANFFGHDANPHLAIGNPQGSIRYREVLPTSLPHRL